MSTAISKDGEALPPYKADGSANLIPGSNPLDDEVYLARVAAAIALKQHKGLTQKEIAELFQVAPSTVKQWFRRARATGLLKESVDPILDKDLVFEALEVLREKLEGGDLTAALALLKGRGVFRNYTNQTGGSPGTVNSINIVYTTPDGGPPPQLTDVATLPGQVIGTPKSDPVRQEP